MKNNRFFQTLFLLVTFCIALQFSASAQWNTNTTTIYPTTLTKNVGIGTSTPTQKLDVNGTTRTTKLQVTNGAVTGYYLKSDASGNASWASPNWLTSGTNQYSALTGNVGIGTSTPTAKLTIAGSVDPLLDLKSSNSNWGTLQFSNANTGNWNIKAFVAPTSADDRLRFVNDVAGTIMTMTGGGNVGIGTVDPGSALTVSSSATSSAVLELHASSEDRSGQVKFTNGNNSGFWYIDTELGDINTDDQIYIGNSGGTKMTITGEGNVGIGTNNPGTALTVASCSADVLELHGNCNGQSNLKFTSDNYNGSWWIATKLASTNASDAMYFGNEDNGTHMMIDGGGNVGIGTLDPKYELSVNGTIQAKEIRVETGWSDFVFEDNFRLRPLAEVEQYIKENKHLPDVTPASEIQAEGLQVAKGMTQMMQKIEELTLYVIELKKDNDALRTQLNNLESSRK